MSRRYIQIFCGTGVGKTSAALGKGIREAGDGKKVVLIQFLKEKQSGDTVPALTFAFVSRKQKVYF